MHTTRTSTFDGDGIAADPERIATWQAASHIHSIGQTAGVTTQIQSTGRLTLR